MLLVFYRFSVTALILSFIFKFLNKRKNLDVSSFDNVELTKRQYDMSMEEYKYVTQEIQRQIKEVVELERYILLAISAIYTWLMSKTISIPLLWGLPPIISFLAYIRTVSSAESIKVKADYIVKMQKETYKMHDTWEMQQYLSRVEVRRSVSKRIFGATSELLWILSIIVTITLAFSHDYLINNLTITLKTST